MRGGDQALTEHEAELLEYYRNVIATTPTLKTEDEGGQLPDGFPDAGLSGEQAGFLAQTSESDAEQLSQHHHQSDSARTETETAFAAEEEVER